MRNVEWKIFVDQKNICVTRSIEEGVHENIFVEATWGLTFVKDCKNGVQEAHFAYMHRHDVQLLGDISNLTITVTEIGEMRSFKIYHDEQSIEQTHIYRFSLYVRTSKGTILVSFHHELPDASPLVIEITKKRSHEAVLQNLATSWLYEILPTK